MPYCKPLALSYRYENDTAVFSDGVRYHPAENAMLLHADPDTLRAVHLVKKHFDATLIPPGVKGPPRPEHYIPYDTARHYRISPPPVESMLARLEKPIYNFRKRKKAVAPDGEQLTLF